MDISDAHRQFLREVLGARKRQETSLGTPARSRGREEPEAFDEPDGHPRPAQYPKTRGVSQRSLVRGFCQHTLDVAFLVRYTTAYIVRDHVRTPGAVGDEERRRERLASLVAGWQMIETAVADPAGQDGRLARDLRAMHATKDFYYRAGVSLFLPATGALVRRYMGLGTGRAITAFSQVLEHVLHELRGAADESVPSLLLEFARARGPLTACSGGRVSAAQPDNGIRGPLERLLELLGRVHDVQGRLCCLRVRAFCRPFTQARPPYTERTNQETGLPGCQFTWSLKKAPATAERYA